MIIQEEEKVEIVEDKKQEEFKKVEVQNEKSNLKVFAYILAFIVILFAILVLIFSAFTFYNLKNKNFIAKGVYIYGINVSGLTKSEAKEKLSHTFDELTNKDIELVHKAQGENDKDYTAYINSSEISLYYDIDSAINYAYNIGKKGNVFSDNYTIFDTMINGINIIPTHSLNKDSLKSFLEKISKDLPVPVVESSYYVENSNLYIVKGSTGYIVDIDQTAKDVMASIDNYTYLTNSVPLTLTEQQPKSINIEAIYKEVYKDPQDAYFTTNPYTVHPAETGIDFSITIDKAKQLLASNKNEIEIPLKTTYPKVTNNMIGKEAFPDLLGSFTTRYSTALRDRETNLKLAAAKINGTVLMPGEVFSYNGVVGKRTIAAGYKEASVYMNGKEVMGLGGGICQVSTTLFNAALFANLKMVEVNNHQFVPGYSSTGRDATVSWGTKDFQFKNSRNYPIRIECSVSGGVAKANIYGLKENVEYDVDVYVNINRKTSTYTNSTTYRRLKLNGKTVSTEKIYNCTYKPH